MQRQDFHYELPDELIAQRPLKQRTASRLLFLDGNTGEYADRQFRDLENLLHPGDLLVLNDTRVIPARLFGHKASGGRVEILIEQALDASRALAFLRASKPTRAGAGITLEAGGCARVAGRRDDVFELHFDLPVPLMDYLDRHGHVPLPPYIRRGDEAQDRRRYQTVFAERDGAVAAPTAGLHFDQPMLERLKQSGVAQCRITLHVGAGTFQPVRVARVEEHHMHAERVEVGKAVCRAVDAARTRGGRVVAVGTTVVRALEAAAARTSPRPAPKALGAGRPPSFGRGLMSPVQPFSGETRLFLYPGSPFRVVDAILTNFHLPESTLLMLVCAFAGTDHVLGAYRHAVAERYRFFSYGDAMFVTGKQI